MRGGGEGIKEMPPIMTKGVFKSFHKLGNIFGETGIFDEKIMRSLVKGERYSPAARLLITVTSSLGLTDSYWNNELKKNGAYEKRYNRPYL